MNLKPKQKRRMIFAACFIVVCLLVELLGRIPGIAFNGWTDIFSWAGIPQSRAIADDELQVHFIDVGNADCILVRQGSHNLLIDAAENTREEKVREYLSRHEVKKLDLVISTHPHSDHMGGMAAILEHFTVERFVMSCMPEGEEPTTNVYERMLNALDRRKISVEEAKPGDTYALGNAKIQIVAPYPLDKDLEDANQISVVARLTYGEHAFLFTGDAEMDLEERMVASGLDLRADVLKVAHHGSKSSTTAAFLRAVSPKYAVISCGRNDYGHPTSEVISRLTDFGAQIYRTDLSGDIVFISDGKNLSIKTEKEE